MYGISKNEEVQAITFHFRLTFSTVFKPIYFSFPEHIFFSLSVHHQQFKTSLALDGLIFFISFFRITKKRAHSVYSAVFNVCSEF